jgi:hypothetical protein
LSKFHALLIFALALPGCFTRAPAPSFNATPGKPFAAISGNLLAQGYRPRRSNAGVVYCKTEQYTGSRLTQEMCFTEYQIKMQEIQAKQIMEEMRDEMDRRRDFCAMNPRGCRGR